ncbi:MAG TPA: hypothetical protein VE871_19860, partial [Longimicrobium sp.]|nr:hypothetical protein [Longimicrobium sp.]
MKKTGFVLMAVALLVAASAEAQWCEPVRPSRRPAERARAEAERAWREALQAEVIDSLRAAGYAEPAGLVVVDVRDRRTGQAEVQTFSAPVQGETVRALLRRRDAHLATWPGRESTFHLRMDPGPAAAPDAVECEPRLLNIEQLQRDLREFMQRESRFFNSARSRERVQVRMLVERGGSVVFAALSRRGTEPLVDRALLDLARRQEFAAATLGGVPIDVWVVLPIEL